MGVKKEGLGTGEPFQNGKRPPSALHMQVFVRRSDGREEC